MNPSLAWARGPALLLVLAPWILAAADQPPVARVTGPEGPLAGARITLVAEDGRVASAETDSGGQAPLPELADAARVLVAAEGYVPVEVTFDEARRAGFSFHLARGRAVELRVTASGTGAPVRTYRIAILPRETEEEGAAALAVAAARLREISIPKDRSAVTLPGLPSGAADLLVMARGFAPATLTVGEDQERAEVELSAKGCTDVRLTDAASGAPLGGVAVVPAALLDAAGSPSLAARLASDVSDDEGRLTVCPLPGTSEFVFLHPRHAPRRWSPGEAEARGGVAEVALEGLAELRVELYDASGAPLAGFPLAVVEGRHSLAEVETGAGGAVSVPSLPGHAELLLVVRAPGGEVPLETRRLVLRPGERRVERIFLEPPLEATVTVGGEPATGTGAVLLGPPEAGAPIEPLSTARTDGDGSLAFHLSGEPPDGALLAMRLGDALLVTRWPPRPREGGERRIDAEGRWISGRVVSAASGRPVAWASLTCAVHGKSTSARVRREPARDGGPPALPPGDERVILEQPGAFARADRRGRFRLFVPRGCRMLTVRAEDRTDERYRRRSVPASGLEDPAEIELEPATGIEVTVAARRGTEVSLSLWRWGGGAVPARVTTARPGGTFLEAPDEGPWLVVAEAEGLAPAIVGPVATPEGIATVTLEPGEGGFLEIEGLRAGDWTSGRIRLVDEAGLNWRPWTEAAPQGEALLRIGPLPPGRWRIEGPSGLHCTLRLAAPGRTARAACRPPGP